MSDEKKPSQEWYSNKDLYEMMVALSKGLEHTNAELGKTQVLIRDYNGLRDDVGKARQETMDVKNLLITCQAECKAKEKANEKVEEVKEKVEVKKVEAVKEVKTDYKKDKHFWIMAMIALSSLVVAIITVLCTVAK